MLHYRELPISATFYSSLPYPPYLLKKCKHITFFYVLVQKSSSTFNANKHGFTINQKTKQLRHRWGGWGDQLYIHDSIHISGVYEKFCDRLRVHKTHFIYIAVH